MGGDCGRGMRGLLARNGTAARPRLETFIDGGVISRMPSVSRPAPIAALRLPLMAAAFIGAAWSVEVASAERLTDPMRFFEGRTESTGTVKLITKNAYQTRSIGNGEIRKDGALHLVQRVEEDGRAPFERRWVIRQVGPGRFSGTMSEAVGAVTVEELKGRFRFRFKMKGSVSVEQWLTPLPGGRSARSTVTIKKFGLTVGKSEGMVRKL